MGLSCAILADSHTEVLLGVRKLLEPLFDAIFVVADERSLVAALEKTSPLLIVARVSIRAAQESNVARRINRSFSKIKFIVLYQPNFDVHRACHWLFLGWTSHRSPIISMGAYVPRSM